MMHPSDEVTHDAAEPRLYADLAPWWPLFSPPVHYTEEAADLLPDLLGASDAPPVTLLELGCGGGSLAFHFKSTLRLTLTDRSPQMLAVSQATNPECEHILGDMRDLELRREFDLVLIHDAIMYATDAASVRAALATAFHHCRPGGGVVIMPDCVRETFQPGTSTGGEDHTDGRGLRYLEWTWDPDPADDTFDAAYSFILRDSDGTIRFDGDRHRFGLFPRAVWLEWLHQTGFDVRTRIDRWNRDLFICRRPEPSLSACGTSL
jgi:SAM-dependent methyltransferase